MSTHVTLYSSQPCSIWQSIEQGQTHYAKLEGIRQKYGPTIAPVFLSAYEWFTREAEKYLAKPPEAQSAIWAYGDLHHLERHENAVILELSVPIEQAIFFNSHEWNAILNQRFVGSSLGEEQNFMHKLNHHGVSYEGDLFRTPFYPQLKQEVIKSWQNLFRFHKSIRDALLQGNPPSLSQIQTALWQLPKAWVKRVI